MKLSKAERESESESEGQKLRCHVCTDFISVDSNGDKLKGATYETTLISPMKKKHASSPSTSGRSLGPQGDSRFTSSDKFWNTCGMWKVSATWWNQQGRSI